MNPLTDRVYVADSNQSLLFVASAVITFGIPCAVLQVTTGGAFLQNTVAANTNPFYLSETTRLLAEFVRAQWLPLLSG